jgi:acyl-coenzyme A synthetase/AMP-(fatty) acid ligase
LRISLVELSEAIRKVEGVTAVACVAFDDEGELGIVAFVTAGTLMSDRELRRGAGDYLPEAMIPNRFLVVDSLPVNRSNKLDERSLLLAAGLERPRVGDLPGATRHAG